MNDFKDTDRDESNYNHTEDYNKCNSSLHDESVLSMKNLKDV